MERLIKNRQRGAFVGLAVGDAVGTTLEFKERDSYEHITDMVGGGVFGLEPGEWTDDTSLALCVADAIANYGMDQVAILKNFGAWITQGEFSHNGRAFDVGSTTRNAIQRFLKNGSVDPECGDPHFTNSGNGGIMRLAPAAIYARSRKQAGEYAVMQSATTHNSPDCVTCASFMGQMLWDLMETGGCKLPITYDFKSMKRDEISSSGYVVHTLEAAIWCVVQTSNFRDAVLLAANLGDDADTVAAIAGQIAGAAYGYENIPVEWRERIVWRDRIDQYLDAILERKLRDNS
jgi:ADP-ribosyl-[dinitrogen reductase] hydrolase